MNDNASRQIRLDRHVAALRRCHLCPGMHKPVVSGGAVVSKVLLAGQAPGDKEPILGRPFAWTAGKKLFRWFKDHTGVDETTFRACVYMAAVCRCFPGKKRDGGDRVPNPTEIANCSAWLKAEMALLQPRLVIAVGKLAVLQFLPCGKLDEVVGSVFPVSYNNHRFDLVPLPHPSGASPWPHQKPGNVLLPRALRLIAGHPAWKESVTQPGLAPLSALR
ncbi:MAG TPA: uracil-DNA glycosylase family protein [Candidatus Methylacidiphilales bacterium]|nr:uracil-DNA glycosylase family protein [Candidatus Methylacidiphilales bacterium]